MVIAKIFQITACKNGASAKRKLLNAGTAKHGCDFVRNDEKFVDGR